VVETPLCFGLRFPLSRNPRNITNPNWLLFHYLNEALINCAKSGNAEFVSVLIENGADPNSGEFVSL
jgi:hypothetical protein